MAFRQGSLDESARHYGEAIELQREEDTGQLANALAGLGAVRREQDDLEPALDLVKESLNIRLAREEKGGIPESLAGLAYLADRSGQPELAIVLLGAVQTLRDRIRFGFPAADEERETTIVVTAKRWLGESQFAVNWTRGMRLQPAEVSQLAMSMQIVSRLAPKPAGQGPKMHGLTTREFEVLKLIVEGKTDRQIADELFISSGTASRHVANILHKLDVRSRSAAAAWAIRNDVT